jgi:hypothetical protein
MLLLKFVFDRRPEGALLSPRFSTCQVGRDSECGVAGPTYHLAMSTHDAGVVDASAGWVLSVDFGTTATAAAVREADGTVAHLAMPNGWLTLPSAVFAEDDGTLQTGPEAENLAAMNLRAFEPTPKRRIDEGTIRLGDHDFTPAMLIGAVLAPVLAEALRQHNNVPPAGVVLTHPVSWQKHRRDILVEGYRRASSIAGLSELPDATFIQEPVAAAQWYAGRQLPSPGKYFAVYDLGGGTFDTTILQSTEQGFQPVGNCGGIDPLGGYDFEQALFNYVGDRHIAGADPDLWAQLRTVTADSQRNNDRYQLLSRIHLRKERLSDRTEVTISPVPGTRGSVTITRDEYNGLIQDHVDATITELEDTLAQAGLTVADLTGIYRIGGAARTPLVGAALERLKRPVLTIDQPKLVVAQGAALIAGATRRAAKPIAVHPPDRNVTPPSTVDKTVLAEDPGDQVSSVMKREPADAKKQATGRNRALWIALAVILGITTVVLAYFYLKTPSTDTPPTDPRVAATAQLRRAIPASLSSSSCDPTSYPDDFTVAIHCWSALPPGVEQAFFYAVKPERDMTQALNSLKPFSRTDPNAPERPCYKQETTPINPVVGTGGVTTGHFSCFFSGKAAAVVWSSDKDRVVGLAYSQANGIQALMDWWHQSGAFR